MSCVTIAFLEKEKKISSCLDFTCSASLLELWWNLKNKWGVTKISHEKVYFMWATLWEIIYFDSYTIFGNFWDQYDNIGITCWFCNHSCVVHHCCRMPQFEFDSLVSFQEFMPPSGSCDPLCSVDETSSSDFAASFQLRLIC